MHIESHTAVAALNLANSTITTLKTVVGLAKDINNNEIKNEISAVLSDNT
jgi:hypothetical protein